MQRVGGRIDHERGPKLPVERKGNFLWPVLEAFPSPCIHLAKGRAAQRSAARAPRCYLHASSASGLWPSVIVIRDIVRHAFGHVRQPHIAALMFQAGPAAYQVCQFGLAKYPQVIREH